MGRPLTAQAAAAMLEPDHPRRTNTRSRTSAAQPRPGLAEPIPRPAPPKVEPVADPLPRRAIVIAPRPDGRRAVARGDGIREVLAAHEVLRAEERPPPAGAVDTRLEAIAAHIPQLVRFAGAGGRRTVRVPGDEPLPLPALADPDWTCLQALLAASRHGLLRVTRHHHLLCLALILRCLAGFDVELRRIPLDLELQDTGQDWLAAIDRLPAP